MNEASNIDITAKTMSLNKNLLNNILSRNYRFCSICFETLEENSVHIEDEIVITKNEVEHTIKVTDMLLSVLGEEVVNVISTFEYICKQCIRSAAGSHKFIMMSKENAISLKTSLENLTSSIEKALQNNHSYKSVIVTIDSDDFSTHEYYDTNTSAAILPSGCSDIDSTMNQEEHNIIKEESDTDFIKPETKKRKRKRNNTSVCLKTTEMLFDKNNLTKLQCKVCKRIYPSLSNLRNHYIRVHAPKNFECSTCGRKFGSMGLLEQHKYQSHCTLVCIECGKTFYNRHTLKMHEIGHYARIVCEDCGRVYKSQSTYRKHIDLNVCGQRTRAHPSDAQFTCDYCNKKYTQKVSLRVHIQYEHGNYKAHVCQWCDKKFWARSRLKAHIVKHTQEKKFGCKICGGKFVSKESLLYHTRIHTGEKPYNCHLCDKSFLSASRRLDHIRRHHPGPMLKCEICNTEFATQLCLEKHRKTHKVTNEIQDKNASNIFERDKMPFNQTPEKESSEIIKSTVIETKNSGLRNFGSTEIIKSTVIETKHSGLRNFGHMDLESQMLGL